MENKKTDWYDYAIDQINKIKALPDNWDGYGTPSPDEKFINKILHLVNRLKDCKLPDNLPNPIIGATCDYTIQIEWDQGCNGLEVILGENDTDTLVCNISKKYIEIEINSNDINDLLKWLEFVF